MQKEEKDKPALVLLHYFGGSALSWQWVTELLPAYHCIVPDLPGFGGAAPLKEPSIEAMARWVIEHIKKQGIQQYTLAGHSMGGKIAVQVAAYDEAAVQRLILVAPSPPSVEPIPPAEKERMLRHPNRQEAETTVKRITVRPLTPAQHNLAVGTQLIADHNSWRWWITEGTGHSIQHQALRIHIPVTILASEDDPSIPFDTIQQSVMPALPGATLVTTKGIGHLSPMEAPEWIGSNIVLNQDLQD